MEENKQPAEVLAEEKQALVQEQAPVQVPAQPETGKKAPKQKKKWTTGKIIGLVVACVVFTFVLILCISLILFSTVKKQIEENPDGELAQAVADAQEQIAEATGKTDDDADEEAPASGPVVDEDSAVDITDIMAGGSYSFTDKSLTDQYYDKVVATVGEHELTCGMFQIFYWTQFQSFMNQYADYIAYLGLDTSIPMSEQNYGEETTWEQHFIEEAMNIYRQYCALNDEAIAKGVTLSEDAQTQLDTLYETMEQGVAGYGYGSVENYLATAYGPGVTFEDYQKYFELYSYAMTYAGKVEETVQVDEDDIVAFYDEHAEDYQNNGIEKIDQKMVNVRHILVQPEKDIDSDGDLASDSSSDEAWAAAEQSANDIYAQWKEDPTEENFAEFATYNSMDPGSMNNGGLYEDVFPGQMVTEFNDWCFDPARKPGDNGIVKTDYGYHIMYFSGFGEETYWHSVAKNDCTEEQFYDLLDEIFERYELTPNYDNLHVYDLLYVTTQEQAAAIEAATAAEDGTAAAEEVPAE